MSPGKVPGGETSLTGLIGHPVAHSHSPAMHNAAFAAAGLNWLYLAWDVAPEALRAAVANMWARRVRGFNVTVPHKVAILPLLASLSEEARLIGAVNTVVRTDEGWRGENTDAEGFLRSLASVGFRPAGQRAVVLGAGGAARAVGYALLGAGISAIHFANRTPARAEQLAVDLSGRGRAEVGASGLSSCELEGMVEAADLIVQATTAGLAGEGLPVPVEWLPPGRLFCELGYGPKVAPVLAEVRTRGLTVLDGQEMLLQQGALSWRRWTGQEPSLQAMRSGLGEAAAAAEEEESPSWPSK